MDDPQLVRFHRQYMQQIQHPTYPPAKLLLEPDVQNQLYRHFFDGPLKGPATYQRRVLKQIILLIERVIDDPDEDTVSDQLMEHMGYLSSLPTADPATEASQTQIITYILPAPLTTKHPPQILIEESPNLLAAGSNVGLRTWEASLHLAQYLYSNPSQVHSKTIIELGAGTGLLSILAAGPLCASHVLATDGLPHVVQTMTANIHRNERTVLPTLSTSIEAKVLDWADHDDPSALENTLSRASGDRPAYDLILGADITYSPDVVPVLAQLLRVLMTDFATENSNNNSSSRQITALISATVRNEKTLSVFRDACVERGLVVEDVEYTCPSVKEQTGFFHEQAFPIVIMRIWAL